jgi:OFA family oxalate/formate antiporter-like MFS transporter
LTRALTSEIFSVYMILCAIFAFVGGWVADRYGPKAVLLVMGTFAFLGLALTSQVSSLWQLFLSYSLLVAIGTGPMFAVATSESVRWFISRRGLALAIVTCGVGLGSIWIAPVAAHFIESFGWRLSFVFIGLIALITIIPSSFFLRRAPSLVVALPEDDNKVTVEINNLDKPQKEIKEFSPRQAVKTKNFWLVTGIWAFHAFCLFTVTTHIVPHAIDSGISPTGAAPILSVLGLASLPSRIVFGPLSDRIGRKSVALMSALLMAASMVWLMWSSGLWMLYVFAAIFGVAYGGLSPATTAMVSDSFGTRNLGSIMGLLEVGWVLGAAVGPALAGYIFDATQKYFLAFLLVAIAAVIIAVLVPFIKSPKANSKY